MTQNLKDKRTMQRRVLSILYALGLIILLAVLGVRGFNDMSVELLLNVATDFAGILLTVSVTCGFLFGEYNRGHGDDYFITFSATTFFCLFFNLIACMTMNRPEIQSLNSVAYLLSYLLKPVSVIFYLTYIRHFSKHLSAKKERVLFALIVCYFLFSAAGLVELLLRVPSEDRIESEVFSMLNGIELRNSISTIVTAAIYYIVIWNQLERTWRKTLVFFAVSILTDILFAQIMADQLGLPGLSMLIPVLYVYCLTCMEYAETDSGVSMTAIDSDDPMILKGAQKKAINADVTVLVCRLHNFGSVSEYMKSEMIIDIFNHFAEEMEPIIESNNGVLVSYSDFGIYAVFGADGFDRDHPEDAVRAALEMQQAKLRLNDWCREHRYPAAFMGIALHSAESIVGSIGANGHMQYSVIYRNVAITERMERLSNDGDIIVSQSTAYRLKNRLTILDSLNFRQTPKASVTTVYRIEGLKNEAQTD